MSENAVAVSQCFPDSVWIDELSTLRDNKLERIVFFDPAKLLHSNATSGDLPFSWDVTSDSIAAYVATLCGASELVLLKSTLPSAGYTQSELTEVGYVDRYFDDAARKLPRVVCVDFRSAAFVSTMVGA
jgi:hypothetical protein